MSSSAVLGIKDCLNMNSLNTSMGAPTDTRVAGLQTLPRPLVRQIASYLADEDVRVAGAVNRSFRQVTEDRRLALDIRRHFSVLRPQSEVMSAFQEFLARIGNLGGYMQGHPLAVLLEKLSRLFDLKDRMRVVDQSRVLIEMMPVHFQRPPLIALLDCFSEISREDRDDLFDTALTLAKQMPPHERWLVVVELVASLAALSEESLPDRFHTLLAMVREAPAGLRSGPMTCLARSLRSLSDDLRMEAFDVVLESIKELPGIQQAQPLVALAGGLGLLPDDLSKLRVLHALLAAVDPMVERQEEVLKTLILGLYGLGSEARMVAHEALSNAAGQLPFEQRMLVQTLLEQVGV